MNLAASTFPRGHASPSRADGKHQEAAVGFRLALNSSFIHFSSSLWLLQSKYLLWSQRKSFNRNKIHELINLSKLWGFFRPLCLLSEASFWKSLFYFPQSTADAKFIYLFIYFYQSSINYKSFRYQIIFYGQCSRAVNKNRCVGGLKKRPRT